LTLSDHVKRAFPFLLLVTYGIFLCSYFIFDEYSEPYRFFARVVFVLAIFILVRSVRETWSQPLFQAAAAYIFYLLLSGFWSEPMDWFRLGQKLTISIYLLSFITIPRYLVRWNSDLHERTLQVCVLFAALAALSSLVVFYSQHPDPGERLVGMGSLTNVNIFSNVYGIFALLAMGFALRTRRRGYRAVLLMAVGVFICFAWFGQSRTAFVSMLLALSTLVVLMQKDRRLLYAAILAVLAVTLVLVFPEVVEQAWLRGKGLRPDIWTQAWAQALSTPVFGHGLVSPVSIEAGGEMFETVHNAYLQVFWQGGVVGLCLFLVLLALAFRNAWSWGVKQRDYTIFCMLLFTACIMMTGVDTLIDRPRDQWMLFWLPLGLLLAYQGMASHSRGVAHPTGIN
jgi:O-antigen ligase